MIGGGEALARAAHEFPPPRLDALRRTGNLTVVFALAVTTLSTFLVVLLVPAADQAMWVNDPLAGLAQHLAGPPWARTLMTLAVAAAAILVVMPAADAALRDAEKLLHRASTDGTLPSGLASLHARFGTPARAIDMTIVAVVLVIIATAGRVGWLARAYGFAIAVMVVLAAAALARLRRLRSSGTPFKTPGTMRLKGRDLPLGLLTTGVLVAISALAMIAAGDIATIASAVLITMVSASMTLGRKRAPDAEAEADEGAADLLLAAELSLDQIAARPGNVLVPVRNPHALSHVVAALQAAGDRDVVVMTARLIDVDVSEDAAGQSTPTAYERRLLSDVVVLAERIGRPVRLMIVPARNVIDAIVGDGHPPPIVRRVRRRVGNALGDRIRPACSAKPGSEPKSRSRWTCGS